MILNPEQTIAEKIELDKKTKEAVEAFISQRTRNLFELIKGDPEAMDRSNSQWVRQVYKDGKITTTAAFPREALRYAARVFYAKHDPWGA